MLYNDYTITISAQQGMGYPASAFAEGLGRHSVVLPRPPAELVQAIAQVDALSAGRGDGDLLTATGSGLFRWLAGPLETHLRIAWDRAELQGRGLRLRLSIDPAEINAWPWELLHDPQRDRTFATSITTPLVRYLDRTDQFGSLTDLKAELPLDMLLVLPQAADLNLVKERAVIEQALIPLNDALRLRVLDGVVTRTRFADALISGDYEIVHGSGHGSFLEGMGYIGLNQADGAPDWVDGQVMGRFVVNCKSLKLGVLNVCSSGKVDEGRAFQGLAPQLVRAGAPAVVAMQYPLSDDAAMAFAEEFYRRLCAGDNSAGRVDVAVTYARNLLAILYPGERYFASPVLYTHAADGVIFALQSPVKASDAGDVSVRALADSLRASADFADDWLLAERGRLSQWRALLAQAAGEYRRHLSGPEPTVQALARQGLALIQQRMVALDRRLDRATAG